MPQNNLIHFQLSSIEEIYKDYNNWPTVDPYSLNEDKRNIYFKRWKAITLYLDGFKINHITGAVNITKSEIYRLLKRCLSFHKDGKINGFRALIPYSRLVSYTRIKIVKTKPSICKSGCAGALSKLFEQYPSLKELVENQLFKKGNKETVHENKIQYSKIHKKLIDACRTLGLRGNDYPLNTKELGYKSICKYLNNLIEKYPEKGLIAREGEDVMKKLGTSVGNAPRRATRPLEIVEFDAHKIDAIWTIKFPHIYMGSFSVLLDRIWILVVIDTFSRAILGYFLSLEKEYTSFDVLRAFKNSLKPWEKMKLTIPGLNYDERGGVPSGILKEYEWAVWDIIVYDNAMANLSESVRSVLKNTFGTHINAGPVTTKDHQPFIESFFLVLEENCYHRLPNTTGSNIKDSRRSDPQKFAKKHEMTLEHLRQITDVFIAKYNGTPHSGIGYATPIEVLERYASNDDFLIRKIPDNKKSSLWLFSQTLTRKVRGNLKTGRRPYIEFFGAHYDSQILRSSLNLIGKEIKIFFDPVADDSRTIMAYLPNGQELGILTIRGSWGRSPHTLEMRREILKLKKRKKLFYLEYDDPVSAYLDYLSDNATKSKSSASKFASINLQESSFPDKKLLDNNEKESFNEDIPTSIDKQNQNKFSKDMSFIIFKDN